jgi:ASPIC and UnbV
VNLELEGTVSNRAAIGARIKITFKENGIERSVYRDVNSGGSFGSNPLRQHIGIGKAVVIERVEIKWPVTGKIQVFENLPADVNFKIKEGDNAFTTYKLNPIDFLSLRSGLIRCIPGKH